MFRPTVCLIVAAALLGGAAAAAPPAPAAAVKPAARQAVVLLYDGKLPEQVKLEELVRTALQEHAGKIDLRSMHAGRAETVPLLRKFNLTRANAPLLLVLDEPGARARILKKVPLDAQEDGRRTIRQILASLKLPLPRVEPPKPGPLAEFAADGGPAEKSLLLSTGGPQRIVEGRRVFDLTGWAAYRFPIPEALRRADLRAEASGPFVLEWADNSRGPWTTLLDTGSYLAGAEERISEPLKPAVELDPILEKLPGSLYVRFRPNGRGRLGASLARMALVARGPGEPSAFVQWALQADELRKRYRVGVANIGESTPLGGVVDRDLVLKEEHSPYFLTSDLVVPWGRKLTIEPGVKVEVGGRYGIQVMGDLIARGEPEKPILFGPAKSGAETWRGIEFQVNRGYFSGARSVLEFCRISGAGAVVLPRFDGVVTSCVIENSGQGIVLRDGGKGRIRHNRFVRCYRGMTVDGGAGEVTDNEWSECLVALSVLGLHETAPFKFERNSVIGSRHAAVNYFKQPNRKVRTLSLPHNHWGNTAPERMLSGGAGPEDVILEPRLTTAPEGVGPVARL